MTAKITRSVTTPVYDTLVAVFVMSLIVSNIASVKIAAVGSVVFDAGTLLFPVAYIVGDVITEVYGFRRLRRILTIAIAMLLLTSATFWLVGILPPAEGWVNQAAYDSILGVVWRIVLASIVAIFVGELVNSYVLARLKFINHGKKLWNRLISSSAAGNLLDTVIFSTIAFAGTMPTSVLVDLIITVFIAKMLIEIAISPLTIRVIEYIKRKDKIDIYEMPRLLN